MVKFIKKILDNGNRIFLKNRLWNLTEDLEYDSAKKFQYRVGLIDNVLLGRARGYVLEVGCGRGRFLVKLKPISGVTFMWGLDISMESLRSARENGFNVIRANGEKLPFKDGVFDAVMSANGSPKEMDWVLLLSEVSRVLKPGGIFAFDTYNKYPLEKIIKYKMMRFLKVTNKPFMGISGGIEDMKEFKSRCFKSGFKITSLYTLFPLPFFPYGILLKGAFFSQLNTHLIGVIEKIN